MSLYYSYPCAKCGGGNGYACICDGTNSAPPKQESSPWVCPKCDRVYGPRMMECSPCNMGKTIQEMNP